VAALVLVLMAGCLYPVREKIDSELCDLARCPIDMQPATTEEPPPLEPMPPADAVSPAAFETAAPAPVLPGPRDNQNAPPVAPQGSDLTLPPGLLPRTPLWQQRFATEKERQAFYQKLFAPLRPVGPDPQPVPGPNGLPLTLADLQHLAMTNSPVVRQAQAAVEAARGAAYQAGLWPNPTVGFEVDTFGTVGGPGYPGGFVDQLIKTAGKLRLARASAMMDVRNAELDLRRAQSDVITRVRKGYFAVLVARENIRLSHLLADFSERAYMTQVTIVRRGGAAGAYEPLYLRYLAVQSRGALVTARNHYTSMWKQLAAAMGTPAMPPTEVAGKVDMPLPVYEFKQVLEYALKHHTDMLKAETSLQQAQLNLQAARVQPFPDVDVRFLMQRDYTGPPFAIAPSVVVSVPVPIWNRNQGGIRQAQANLVQASDQPHTVTSNLTTTLSDAFERYSTNREQVGFYRDLILPDLVRVYTAIYLRYRNEAPAEVGPLGPLGAVQPPAFGDVIVAQGNLAAALSAYITSLDALWAAVADVTDVLQTRDVFQLNGAPVPIQCVPRIPECDDIPKLQCTHPCSPLPGAHLLPPNGDWPPVVAAPDAPRMKTADEEARRRSPIEPPLAARNDLP
jgi:cobalt-zinc-cadmium efflux system outer membrane protein